MGKYMAVNVDCHNCREPSDRVIHQITVASLVPETLQVNDKLVDVVTLRIRGTSGFEDLRCELTDALSRFDAVHS